MFVGGTVGSDRYAEDKRPRQFSQREGISIASVLFACWEWIFTWDIFCYFLLLVSSFTVYIGRACSAVVFSRFYVECHKVLRLNDLLPGDCLHMFPFILCDSTKGSPN